MLTSSRFAAAANQLPYRHFLCSIVCFAAMLGAVTSTQVVASDETVEACEAAATLLKEEDIDGALEEAGWCLEGIQQLKQQQMLAVLPDEVEGYTGGETNSQKVMGVRMIERTYTRDTESINVSLMGGGPATTGLAALAALGLNMGDGGKKLRIQRRTVVDMSNGNSIELMVKLKSGGMMTIKSTEASRDSVVSFARSFPIKELDEALDDN